MREIKFRGKALTGSWVFGNFIHSKHLQGKSNEFRIKEIDSGLEHDIEINTIGQFTGIHDKNGKEIYDGDVIIASNGTRQDIRFGVWKFEINTESGADEIDGIGFSFSGYEPLNKSFGLPYEVIGNIHENPELLK